MVGNSELIRNFFFFFFHKPISFHFLPATPRLHHPTLSQFASSSSSSASNSWSQSTTSRWRFQTRRSSCSLGARHNLKPGRSTYLLLLKSAATDLSSHHLVTSIHCQILKSGFKGDVFVATALVDALSKRYDVDSAYKLFEEMPERDVAAWNAMLSGYSRNGYANDALSLFRLMGLSGTPPNSLTLSILLHVYSDFDDKGLDGRCVHAYACRCLGLGDTFLHNSLLVYYNRCGDVYISERLFKRMLGRDVVSWNSMISGYAMNGLACEALEAFHYMRQEGLCPDLVTLETTLQACAEIGDDAIKDGELVHTFLVRLGFPTDTYTENSLLLMYCKCGRVVSGRRLFDDMTARNIVSLNILIDGYVRSRFPERALALFKYMRSVDSELSSNLLVGTLQAVKLLGESPELVMCFHCLVVVLGFGLDEFVISSLISAYGECGEVATACRCFDYSFTGRSNGTVCFNTMLSVYVHNRYPLRAVELLHCMQVKGCVADAVTLVNALSACTQLLQLKLGKAVHGYIIRHKFDVNVFVTTSLLEFYVRCGNLSAACWLFAKMPSRSTASWNTMIFGCLENGFPRVSLNLFHCMQQLDKVMLDVTTIVGVIQAISQRGHDREGNYIHTFASLAGFENNEFVANSLIAMYSRFCDLDTAGMVFDRVGKPSKVTWNAMITEYSRHGMSEKAISLFHLMKLNNVALDAVTLLSVLSACTYLASLYCAKWIHAIICKAGFESDVYVVTSLLDMYAKCGDLSVARLIFDKMSTKTTISWNSMICCYGVHGHVEEADKLFYEMQRSGIEPDLITFVILLSACSHAGEVEKGLLYLNLMIGAYSLPPRIEHYSCIADLLGRRGLVNEAFEFLEKIPMDPGKCAWGSLLGACRVQGKIEFAFLAAKKLFELDPLEYGYHVLLSNMLSESGRWMGACKIRWKLKDMGHKKVQGWSMVET